MIKQNKKYIHDITQYNMIISLINFINYVIATFRRSSTVYVPNL